MCELSKGKQLHELKSVAAWALKAQQEYNKPLGENKGALEDHLRCD